MSIGIKLNNQGDKLVLGVSSYFHDSAAALVCGNKIIAAAQEERFTRRKADWRFPQNAIDYCLSNLPQGRELDAVAYYEDPALKIDRILRSAVSNAPRGTAMWPKTLETLHTLNTVLPQQLEQVLADPGRIFFTPHHRSHAASAYFPSPFEHAATLVVDGVGEWATTSIWLGDKDELTLLRETRFPHSLGLLYSAFTQYCGFKVNSGEYKLMGLASFGQPVFKKLIYKHLIEVDEDGGFRLNLEYFNFETGTSTISPLFNALFKYPPRKPTEMVSMHYMNVAASIQTVLNEIMTGLAGVALTLSNSRHLCMAGGVALNCVANREIADQTKGLEGIWVQPAAGDAGGALGAALDISWQLNQGGRKFSGKNEDRMEYTYLGPAYSAGQIEDTLQKFSLVWTNYLNNEDGFVDNLSNALQSGEIIGYFDGRMEFGPRALGNRSILADPRPKHMLQRANQKIKFREGWRPFAPMVLLEREKTLFETEFPDPYMLFTSRIKEEFRSKPGLQSMRANGLSELSQYLQRPTSEYPAVTHYDYSARTQSLSEEANPRLHAILTHFYENTGCPMLLNTSFNVRGEPIVCSPEDAVKTFLNTDLDSLAIGPYFLRRSEQTMDMSSQIGSRKFRAD